MKIVYHDRGPWCDCIDMLCFEVARFGQHECLAYAVEYVCALEDPAFRTYFLECAFFGALRFGDQVSTLQLLAKAGFPVANANPINDPRGTKFYDSHTPLVFAYLFQRSACARFIEQQMKEAGISVYKRGNKI